MIQLKVYKNNTRTEQFWLDLYDSEPIKLTLSIEDITNADATSTYSKAFKVPGTRKNNDFFQQAFEINGVLFDVTVKKPAVILVDGAEFRQGHVRLNRMVRNTELDRFDYELVFLGETRDFSSIIGDAPLCSLQMNDLLGGQSNLPITREDIIYSWDAFPQLPSLTAGLHNGDIIYPLIDHGNSYNDAGAALQPEIRTSTGPLAKPFTISTNPLNINQMYPMIRAKRIWDQIFEDAGYTYDSSFINSNRFHQMYVSAFGNEAVPGYDATAASEYNFSAAEIATGGNYQGYGVQSAMNVVVDPSGSWDGTTYTCPASGSYTFTGSAYFYGYTEIISSWPPQNQYEYGVLEIFKNGVAVVSGSAASYSTTSVTGTIICNAGDTIQFFINCNESANFISVTAQSFACTQSPGNINPSSLLECTYKQIDFIKDILLMFRLVLSPDPNDPRNFIVEPWQTYINSGQLYDWSKKLVEEKDVVIEPVFFSQSDQITFTQPTDGDWINVYHMQAYKHNWGWLQFDSGNELLKGTRDIKVTGIANTPMTQIEGQAAASTWILPQLHTHSATDTGTQHGPIKAKTRLLFYNGTKASPNSWYLVNNAPLNSYPLMSQYETWPITPTSLNLAFSNDVQYWGTEVTPLPASYNGNGTTLYDSYWSRYINSLYNKYSRRVTAYFVLNNIDLNTFSFDDTIFVNGVYYIPEKIIDVQIGAYTEVQVQLLTANDFVPTFSNETLNATAVGINTECVGSLGSIQVECGGAGPIDWTLSNGMSGQFNNYSPPPYSFNIANVPVGSWTITLTDAIGRSYSSIVTVPLGSSPTATSTHTNATPGLCDGSIVVTPSSGAGTTIFWSDQYPLAGTFTRNNLCCGPYSYFVRDADGCSSPSYLVQVECPPPTFIYEAHEFGKLCNTLSGTAIIVQSSVPLPINDGTVFGLDTIPGCFAIVATSTLTPIANVVSTYPSCEVCKEPTPIETFKDWYFFSHFPGGLGGANYVPNANTQSSADKLLTDGIRDYYMPLNPQPVPPQILDEVSTTQNLSTAFPYLLNNIGYVMPGAQTFIWPGQLNGFSWSNPEIASPSVRIDNSFAGYRYYVAVKNSIFNDFFEYNAITEKWIGPKMWIASNNTEFGGTFDSGSYSATKSFTLGGVAYTLLLSESTFAPIVPVYGVDPLCYLKFAGIGPTPTPIPPTPTPMPSPTPPPNVYYYNIGVYDPEGTCTEGSGLNQNVRSFVPLEIGTAVKLNNISFPASEILNDYTCYWIRSSAMDYQADVATAYDTCSECQFGPAKFYYEAEECNTLEVKIIQSDFELTYGDVYTLTGFEGCWQVTIPCIASGVFPEPEVAWISCGACNGLPSGNFLSSYKPRNGDTGPVCANDHTLFIYNFDVTDAQDLQIGMTMWADPGMTTAWNGASLWYSIANPGFTGSPIVSLRIDSIGQIIDIVYCVGPTCQEYTIGGYDIGSCQYLDCDGYESEAYYNGPSASGYDQTSFCATKILSYTGSEPWANGFIC